MGTRKRLVVAAGALLLVTALATACGLVKAPTNDTTPPIITWQVLDNTTSTTKNYGNTGTWVTTNGDAFTVTEVGYDSEGLHQISLSLTGDGRCESGDVGGTANGIPDLGIPEAKVLTADKNGNVLTTWNLVHSFIVKIWCNDGYTLLPGAYIRVDGTATNYFGGTSTGYLVFTVS